uniref:Uncharacterized protein n=1 Tax=viral metagenome TaxID=1070528 RepID=A0A6C0EIH3_9ZZZZ
MFNSSLLLSLLSSSKELYESSISLLSSLFISLFISCITLFSR